MPLFAIAEPDQLGSPFLLLSVISLVIVAFWIWMLVDCATKETSNNKLLWILLIALSGIIGAAIYFFVRKLPRR